GKVLGHRKAAFLGNLLAFAREDFGVDEDQWLIVVLRYVDDDDALVDVHLRGRKTDPGGRIHRLEHVVDELGELHVELRDPLSSGAQSRVGVFEDGSEGHGLHFRVIDHWTTVSVQCSEQILKSVVSPSQDSAGTRVTGRTKLTLNRVPLSCVPV